LAALIFDISSNVESVIYQICAWQSETICKQVIPTVTFGGL
jgi:hypothetical protein